jgi:hypothetical protein
MNLFFVLGSKELDFMITPDFFVRFYVVFSDFTKRGIFSEASKSGVN